MKNIALCLAYDGTSYFGWQTCNAGATIEEQLQNRLEQILQHPITLQAASRTDRGVHAKGQVVNFFTDNPIDLNLLKYRLNSLLPKTIVIRTIDEKPSNFHPTIDVTGKEYLYTICNTPIQLPEHRLYSWHIPKALDLDMMKETAASLLGTRDFAPFANKSTYSSTIRTLHAITITPLEGGRLQIALRADHFLYKMARNLVGHITGKEICAPAHGLTLNCVFY